MPIYHGYRSIFGFFLTFKLDYMRKGLTREFVGIKDLGNVGIVKLRDPLAWEDIKAGPQVQPPLDTEATAAMRANLPTRHQRPLHRSERPLYNFRLGSLAPRRLL